MGGLRRRSRSHLRDLHARVHRGAYRARPSRRAYIPKPDGRLRPLGIAALEDKILQRAVVEVLNAIYEADFLGFSYGFRPGRSPHDALDALAVGIKRKVSWVLDLDFRDYFSRLDHQWLERFVEHRIADKRVLRLIQKWMAAGVIEDGSWTAFDEGVPQGASVSPLLANVYAHYVFDLWAHQWRRRHARGQVVIVRFADDAVVGFEYREDAERFHADLRRRLAKFNLELAAEKTRLIEFGRFAARDRERRGLGKPETFRFLGFTHICGKTRGGRFQLKRITDSKRIPAKLAVLRGKIERRQHLPIDEQGRWLASALQGHYNYYAVPDNIEALHAFREQAVRYWFVALRRRSQRTTVTWERMSRLADRWLPQPRDPAPLARGAIPRSYPRQEPSAVVPHAGICAGGGPNLNGEGPSLPRPLATREGAAKRWIGVHAGRLLSLEMGLVRGADAVIDVGRQHRWRRFREPPAGPAGSENPGMWAISSC